MQPKRFLTYRLLPDLGVITGFNFGTRRCAARIEIIHTGLTLSLSSIRLVSEGQDVVRTPRKTLSLAVLRDLEPAEANAALWVELKDFWLKNYRDILSAAPPLKTEVRWSIEEYATSHGLDSEETAMLLRHAAEVTAIVDSSSCNEEDDDGC